MKPFNIDTWREMFKAKEIMSESLGAYLDEIIKPGSRICIGSACSEPIILTYQLVKEKWKWTDCQLIHFFTLSNQKYFSEKFPTRFRHNTLSIIGTSKMRSAINRGKADYTPLMASEIPQFLKGKGKRIHIDVALIQTSPPDKNGYLSLGINVDVNKAIVESAETVIVQINPKMPRTIGNSFIKFSDIDHFIYQESELLEYQAPKINEASEKIANYVSRLIQNGSTLNLGIGKVTYILPKFLTEKKNLALYSEVLMESIVPLIKSEVITCSKNSHPHCMTSFILGSREFYDYVNNNPFIEFHPTDFLTDSRNLKKNRKLCSIYSILSVDLIGQGTNHKGSSFYGGFGGLADYMRGSSISDGGKCIIALPSVTRDGKSRILPLLPPGPVSLRTIDIHYIVTEWGVAYLHGKSIRDRVLQMIGVAHPDHRQWLLDEAKKLNYIYDDQIIPSSKNGVVVIRPDVDWSFQTKSKGKIRFFPVKPTDERLLQDLYYSLSEEDRVLRFFTPQQHFSHKDTQSKVICDYQTNYIIVGIVGKEQEQKIIAAGAYYLEPNTNLVEFSVTIHEDYRREGLARQILLKIIELAHEKGYSGVCGDVHVKNIGMLQILNTLKFDVIFNQDDEDDDTLRFSFYF
ncbi:MAG: GNAT family N-acetyltransferase [archaeon]|nr:GNAT family N-acetyltransferase [archaeon]